MNDAKQQEALNNFNKVIEKCFEIGKQMQENENSSGYQKAEEEQQNAYINAMTDMVFLNPYVFVQMESAEASSDFYHSVAVYQDGSKHHSAVMRTDANKLNPAEHYQSIPFVDFAKKVMNDDIFEHIIVASDTDQKYVIYKQTLALFLQFTSDNIEFIGF